MLTNRRPIVWPSRYFTGCLQDERDHAAAPNAAETPVAILSRLDEGEQLCVWEIMVVSSMAICVPTSWLASDVWSTHEEPHLAVLKRLHNAPDSLAPLAIPIEDGKSGAELKCPIGEARANIWAQLSVRVATLMFH